MMGQSEPSASLEGGVADISEGHAAVQRDLNRLEKWAKRYLMKFSKGSCKALHLERRNPRQHNLLEADQLESSSQRGALESWWTAS